MPFSIHLLGLRGRGGNCRAPWSRANERSDSDTCEGRGANLGGWAASLRPRRQHLGGLIAWVRCPWRCGLRGQPRSRPGIALIKGCQLGEPSGAVCWACSGKLPVRAASCPVCDIACLVRLGPCVSAVPCPHACTELQSAFACVAIGVAISSAQFGQSSLQLLIRLNRSGQGSTSFMFAKRMARGSAR